MPRWLRFVILALILVLLSSLPLAKLLEDGAIEGYVTNQNGPVAGATAEAQNLMNGEVVLASSDTTGYYRIDLPPGRYSLWIKAVQHTWINFPKIPVGRGEIVRKDVQLSENRGQASSP